MSKRIKAIEAQNSKLKAAYTKLNTFYEDTKQWISSEVVTLPVTSDVQSVDGDLIGELDKWKSTFTIQQEERDNGIATMQKVHAEFADNKEKTILGLEQELRKLKLTQVTGSDPSLLADTLRAEITKLEQDCATARTAAATSQAKTKSAESMAATALSRTESLETSMATLKQQLQSSIDELKVSQSQVVKGAATISSLEEKVVYLQMQQQSGKEVAAGAEELKASLTKAEEGREMLKRALTELRSKHKESMAKVSSLESSANASAVLLLEKDSLLKR
jgi:chromosome segregation ATPase